MSSSLSRVVSSVSSVCCMLPPRPFDHRTCRAATVSPDDDAVERSRDCPVTLHAAFPSFPTASREPHMHNSPDYPTGLMSPSPPAASQYIGRLSARRQQPVVTPPAQPLPPRPLPRPASSHWRWAGWWSSRTRMRAVPWVSHCRVEMCATCAAHAGTQSRRRSPSWNEWQRGMSGAWIAAGPMGRASVSRSLDR